MVKVGVHFKILQDTRVYGVTREEDDRGETRHHPFPLLESLCEPTMSLHLLSGFSRLLLVEGLFLEPVQCIVETRTKK